MTLLNVTESRKWVTERLNSSANVHSLDGFRGFLLCQQKLIRFACVVPRSIIERTIRAAVEQHFFDLKSSIDQDISSYESQG